MLTRAATASALCLLAGRQAAGLALQHVDEPAAAAAVPAPAPAAAPAGDEVYTVGFTLEQINYDDLEKGVPTEDDAAGGPGTSADFNVGDVGKFFGNTVKEAKKLGKKLKDKLGGSALAQQESNLRGKGQLELELDLTYEMHVGDLLADAIGDAITEVVQAGELAAPAPAAAAAAPGPAPATFVNKAKEAAAAETTAAAAAETTAAPAVASTTAAAAAAPAAAPAASPAASPAAAPAAASLVSIRRASAAPAGAPAAAAASAPAASPAAPVEVEEAAAAAPPAGLAPLSPSPAMPALPQSTMTTTTTVMPVDVFVAFKSGKSKPVDVASFFEMTAASFLSFDAAPPPVNNLKRQEGEHVFRHMNPVGSSSDSVGSTTRVEVSLTPKATTTAEQMDLTKAVVQHSIDSGDLTRRIQNAVAKVSGVNSTIDNLKAEDEKVERWDVTGCETHMSDVAKKFSVAYTRRMVPMAIFNECTNFLPALSFSPDFKPTMMDVTRCRQATVNFVKHWNYGGHGSTKAPPNFNAFCMDVCTFRYGEGSPKCMGR